MGEQGACSEGSEQGGKMGKFKKVRTMKYRAKDQASLLFLLIFYSILCKQVI